MQSEDDDNLKKMIHKAMAQEEEEPRNKKFFFSPEINLGHLVVALTFMLGAFATYLSFHDSNLDHKNRVSALEKQQTRTDETLSQLTRSQVTTEKAVTQLTWIVEQIQKDKK